MCRNGVKRKTEARFDRKDGGGERECGIDGVECSSELRGMKHTVGVSATHGVVHWHALGGAGNDGAVETGEERGKTDDKRQHEHQHAVDLADTFGAIDGRSEAKEHKESADQEHNDGLPRHCVFMKAFVAVDLNVRTVGANAAEHAALCHGDAREEHSKLKNTNY